MSRTRVLGMIGVTVFALTVCACGSSGSHSAAPTTSPVTQATNASPVTSPPSSAATTTTVAKPACTEALTTDSYDGFHIGVPPGWTVFTLDGMITVSKDSSGTEEVSVLPALATQGLSAASFFSSSLATIRKEVSSSGGTFDDTVADGGPAGPTATLSLQAGSTTMTGKASIEVLPEASAHGSQQLAVIAAWAPVADWPTDEATLEGIGACYGPQPGTLFQVIQDQVFTYAMPPGWKVDNETQDALEVADDDSASASYTLTLAPQSSGVDSASTLLTWALGQLGVKVDAVLGSVSAAPTTNSAGGVSGQIYEQFTGSLTATGQAIHGLVNVNSSTGGGVTSGVIRLGLTAANLWNSDNGAVIQIMGSIQHNFTQDLEQWQQLSQQWQTFDQNEQGFDDALNGVDIVHDSSTGETFEAPYDTYDNGGSDGPGYYDEAGNKLQIQTP